MLLRSAPPRRGVVLAYLAPVLLIIFGFAALIIDMGTARMTQRQMQAAADTAALEGLRGRDDMRIYPDPNGTARNTARRQAASDIVSWLFDDDYDLEEDKLYLGAGPDFDNSSGV